MIEIKQEQIDMDISNDTSSFHNNNNNEDDDVPPELIPSTILVRTKSSTSSQRRKQDSASSSAPAVSEMSRLELTEYDILCGRNKLAFNHVGNRRFRVTISLFLNQYFQKPGRTDRSILILRILDTINKAGGHFLKEENVKGSSTSYWVELSEKEKRNKIGHALRDAAAAHTTQQEKRKKANQRMAEAEARRHAARTMTPPPMTTTTQVGSPPVVSPVPSSSITNTYQTRTTEIICTIRAYACGSQCIRKTTQSDHTK